MEIQTALPLIKCSGSSPSSHEGKVFGLCTKCGEHVCTKCSATRHYDHLHSFYAYDLECAYLANFITKLKGTTQKALKTRNKLLPFLQFQPHVDFLEANIDASYNGFIEMLKSHCEDYMNTVKCTNIVKRLRDQLDSLTTGRIKQMEDLRAKLNECKEKLMNATINGKYFANLGIVAEAEKYKAELDSLVEAQQRETDAFHAQIRRFKEIFVATDYKPLEDACKVQNIDKLDAKLYKICRETEILISFSVTTKKITEIHFSDYAPPYNAGVLEILGNAYIIGGCLVDGTPTTEEPYSNHTVTVDLDSGLLVQKDSMRDSRMCFGATVQDNRAIYVVGGYNHLKAIAGCEKYDLKKGIWTSIPDLTKPKSNTGVCIFNEFLYCFGGYLDEDEEERGIERLCISETEDAKWEVVPIAEDGLWKGIQNPGAIQISDREILIFGGKSDNQAMSQSLIFCPEQNTFEETSTMKHPDTMLGCKPIIFQGKVYAFGCHENYLHVYNVGERTWEGLTAFAVGALTNHINANSQQQMK
eukprot:TRINITY_DN2644_c1_g1_i1.p1 TRINITY_DN2644_c1_g1~~TRINITY_DN2644_c1_g1_i1.p1  ORF type:complete len:529 (+),score=49.98 TRINITY_DN2644_c1_g1_i1:7119-8705(+)